MNWSFVNSDFVETDKAMLHISDLSVQRGYGVFDFFRTSNHVPLFIDDHLDRFFHSAKELFLDLPFNRAELKAIIRQLLDKNQLPDSGVRITATGGYSADGYAQTKSNLIIQQKTMTMPSAEKWEAGLKLMTYEYLRDLPTVKSINYLMGVWIQKQIAEKKVDDVLYVKNGIISELPRSNIFIVTKGGELITPGNNVLQGITRKRIFEFASAILPLSIRDVSVSELKTAAEVFVSSSSRRIMPVIETDGQRVVDGKPGEITRRLHEIFLKVEKTTTQQS